MPSVASSRKGASSSHNIHKWRPTKQMNMRDLSRDDDFLSHLLVEKLGTGDVPLLVHKMDANRRYPKADPAEVISIVRRRLVEYRGSLQQAIRHAVDDLLSLNAIRWYLRQNNYTEKQINAFATHASRYFELYLPTGAIEIAHTTRYTHRTGKSELCILATRPLAAGAVISELKGSMADLTEEEDKDLKRTDRRSMEGIRRDFSVIHSKQLKKNHLFLGPARFVNHDCENNCELFREGRYITFRVIKPIGRGEEITAHYGDGYFGRKNRHCLCETCERHGRGGYAPQLSDDESSDSDSHSDDDSSSLSSSSDEESDPSKKEPLNVNERRTRRGVYHVVAENEDDSDSDEEEDEDKEKTEELPVIDLQVEADPSVGPTPPPMPMSISSITPPPAGNSSTPGMGLMTPDSRPPASATSSLSSLPTTEEENADSKKSPFKSVISTRAQKARQAQEAATQLATPPRSEEAPSPSAAEEPRAESRPPLRRSNRFRRETEEPAAADKDKGRAESKDVRGRNKEKEIRPAARAREDTRDRNKSKVKEESRARSMRSESVNAGSSNGRAQKMDPPEPPIQDDLPRCMTCRNVLPVISVDSHVVWGLTFEAHKKGKGKKEEKAECPRCMRHFAIYGCPWPGRSSGQRSSYIPTPRREESVSVDQSANRKVTHKALPTLDRKLEAAADSRKRREREKEDMERPKVKEKSHERDDDHRAAKRRRTDPGPLAQPRMSAKAREALLNAAKSRSGRNRVPSLKVREVDPPKKKRGRPPKKRRHTEPPVGDVPESSEKLEGEINGRFGKKDATNGIFGRKKYPPSSSGHGRPNRAQRAAERSMAKAKLEKARESQAKAQEMTVKREEEENGLYSSQEQSFHDTSDDDMTSGERPEEGEYESSPRRMRGSMLFGQRMGGLLRHGPNPTSFARRKWFPKEAEEKEPGSSQGRTPEFSTDDDTDSLITPENRSDSSDVVVAEHFGPDSSMQDSWEDVESDDDTKTLTATVNSLPSRRSIPSAITFKPNPVNLAKRRWAMQHEDDSDDGEDPGDSASIVASEHGDWPLEEDDQDGMSTLGGETPPTSRSSDIGWYSE